MDTTLSGLTKDVDEALKADSADEVKRKELENKRKEKIAAFTKLLRTIGAIVLVASALTFMFQQWGTLNHLERYFSFLGFTVVLSVAGFFCGLRMKEDKGARTFLALAAGIIPVHFCQLGGFLYSRFGHGLLSSYPQYALWTAVDEVSALVTAIVGAAVLSVVALVSFSALARSDAKRLTLSYIALNSALLIPTRQGDWIGLIAFSMAAFVMLFDLHVLRANSAMRTKEGNFTRAMLAAPIFVIIGRSLHLYLHDVTALFASMICAALAFFLFVFAPRYVKERSSRIAFEVSSIIPATLAWLFLAYDIARHFRVGDDYLIPLYSLPLALILAVMSLLCSGDGQGYRKAAALVAIASTALQLICVGSTFSSFLMIVGSMVTLVYGYIDEDKTIFLTGVLGFIFGIAYHLRYAIELCTYSPWVSLGVVGVATVLASSYVEKNHRLIAERIVTFRRTIRRWK